MISIVASQQDGAGSESPGDQGLFFVESAYSARVCVLSGSLWQSKGMLFFLIYVSPMTNWQSVQAVPPALVAQASAPLWKRSKHTSIRHKSGLAQIISKYWQWSQKQQYCWRASRAFDNCGLSVSFSGMILHSIQNNYQSISNSVNLYVHTLPTVWEVFVSTWCQNMCAH